MIYKSYLVEKNIDHIKDKFVLFYGENLGMLNDFKENIKTANSEVEIIKFDNDDIIKNTEHFFKEVLNFSLFEKKKIFFINNANDKILSIIEEIGQKIDQQKIYLFSSLLDKKSKLRSFFEKSKRHAIIPCYLDNEISIKNIILNKLKNFKGLSPENINLITENCNNDRVKLNNELNKINLFFQDKNLKKEELMSLLNVKVHDDFNALRDMAIKGDKTNTNKLLNNSIIDADKSTYYLAFVNQRFGKLLSICELQKDKNIEQILNSIKPPIFWKEKPIILEQLKKWNIKRIKKVQSDIYNLEIKIKTTSTIDKNIIIKKLIVDICNLANA
ncbi:MAG: DNA polymerase III subunit delta [Candidatus Pelagibacter sp.]